MESTLPYDDQAPLNIKSWQLWFSLAAGIVVWVIHLTIVYALTSLACEWGWFPFTVGDLTGLQFVQIVITLIAAAIVLVSAFFALRNHQRLVHADVQATNRHRFMAYLGLTLNILFIALILVPLIPILTFTPCG